MDRSTYEQLDRIEEAQAEMLDKIQSIMVKLGIEEELVEQISDDDDF